MLTKKRKPDPKSKIRSRALYDSRRSRGLCVDCTKPVTGAVRCIKCAANQIDHKNKHRSKKEGKELLVVVLYVWRVDILVDKLTVSMSSAGNFTRRIRDYIRVLLAQDLSITMKRTKEEPE